MAQPEARKLIEGDAAALLLKVSRSTIWQWTYRNRIHKVDTDPHGRALYYLDEILAMKR